MRVAEEAALAGPATRPQVHFTADRGWINDPHGVVWHDGVYHLFYQYVPDSTTWSSQCSWGHAVSTDLVGWRTLAPALTPGPDERGCWSGAAVVTDAGEIDLFYTRVQESRLAQGMVVRACPSPDGATWSADPAAAIVTAPREVAAHSFRDPCVLQYDDHWVMVVGAGLPGGRAALVNFVSPDLRSWSFTGLAAARLTEESEPVLSGGVGECPQLFEIDGTWVLLVSVWDDDRLHHVVAATGSYDGRTFIPGRWQQLTFGLSAYAMTSFVDRTGRRCVMCWLREAPDHDPESAVRAGAHSLSYVVTVDQTERVRLSLHPDVATLRQAALPVVISGGRHSLFPGPAADVEVEVTAAAATLLISAGERTVLDLPLPASSRIVLDADIVEISSSEGLCAHRLLRLDAGLTLQVLGAAGVRAWSLASPWMIT